MTETQGALRIVLSVHHEKNPNAGAAGVTLALADEYRRMGHEVRVFGFDDMRHHNGSVWEQVRFPFFVAAQVSPMLKARQVDVVDCSTGDAWALRRSLLRQAGAVLVTRSHGLEHRGHDARKAWAEKSGVPLSWKYPLYNGGPKLWMIKRSIKLADLAFFLNECDRNLGISKFGLPPSSAIVVRNGLPPELIGLPFDTSPRGAAPALAFIGTFDFRKGADTLVAVAGIVLGTLPGAHLTLLGTGRTENEILTAFEPSIRDRITVVPTYPRRSLPSLLQNQQILLFPSRGEGLPTAVLEAMACGLVVVASDIPGCRDILAGTGSGILVPEDDATEMSSAVLALLGDRLDLERRRRSSREVAQHYAVSQVASTQLALYREALEARRGRSVAENHRRTVEARHGI